jgi:hypothetical protein
MSYQAIINGARGLLYFGADYQACLNERDRKLGWNWTYYDRVLKPVLDELRADGPLYPALVAPDAKVPVTVEGAADIEFTFRETARAAYLIAAKREGSAMQVQFRGLPAWIREGQVLFEEPRNIAVTSGGFDDWFGPNEVHVYRFANSKRKE